MTAVLLRGARILNSSAAQAHFFIALKKLELSE